MSKPVVVHWFSKAKKRSLTQAHFPLSTIAVIQIETQEKQLLQIQCIAIIMLKTSTHIALKRRLPFEATWRVSLNVYSSYGIVASTN